MISVFRKIKEGQFSNPAKELLKDQRHIAEALEIRLYFRAFGIDYYDGRRRGDENKDMKDLG